MREVDLFFCAIRDGEEQAALDRMLMHLAEYVETHFRTEESFMVDAQYPAFPAHKATHDALRVRVKNLVEAHLAGPVAVTPEVADYLKDWLVDHLYNTDLVMAEYLRQSFKIPPLPAQP